MTTYQVTNVDQYGRLFLRSETDGAIHREVILPGYWDGPVWTETDVSTAPQVVQDAAADEWTAQVVSAYKAAFPYVAPVPAPPPGLLPYQFFAMLEISGKKTALYAFIDALPSPQKIVAREKLDRSLAFHRDNDLVLAAQSALSLTDAQLDALWLQAAAL